MITIGEKIILGTTALFLSGLCLFSVMDFTTEATVLETAAPVTIVAETTTQIQADTPLTQEDIVPEIVLINLNTATLEELDQLPGIGETLAQRIIDHRTEYGDFETVADITAVSGIGETIFFNLELYACVE